MCSLYRNKYRIESDRLHGYDYSRAGAYFVTICTKNRIHYFGEIVNGEMKLSGFGLLLQNEWSKTPEIRPDMNIILDEFIVLPDHFHGIIIIGKNQFNDKSNYPDNGNGNCRFAMHGDSTITPGNPIATKKTAIGENYYNRFGPQSKNLSSIIRGFKSSITVYARKNNLDFAWQSRFYDHLIRNDKELCRIRKYILNNPVKWNDQDQNKIHY